MTQAVRARGSVRVALAAGAACVWAQLTLPRAAAQSDGARAASSSPAPHVDSAHVRTRVSMRRVNFYVDTAVVLHIRHLDGTMRSKNGGP
ncbi:MAG: hypothetical protein ACM34L_06740, partial [Gemmatimonas sp.]